MAFSTTEVFGPHPHKSFETDSYEMEQFDNCLLFTDQEFAKEYEIFSEDYCMGIGSGEVQLKHTKATELIEFSDILNDTGSSTGRAEHCMLASDAIEESESPWTTQAVLMAEKDGRVRCCVDYLELNTVTVPDPHPKPRIDDLRQGTKKAEFMTTVELKAGYWQVPIKKRDQQKTAFIAPRPTLHTAGDQSSKRRLSS